MKSLHQWTLSAMLLCASQAHAGLVVNLEDALAGNSEDFATDANDVIGNAPGYFGAAIYVDEQGAEGLSFEFVGSEAPWNSWFTVENEKGANTIANRTWYDEQDKQGPTSYEAYPSEFKMDFAGNQLLDFEFIVDSEFWETRDDKTVANGANRLPSDDTRPNFWLGFEYDVEGVISALILGLDDGGAGPDADYDDLVIRISHFDNLTVVPVSEVPLPAALPLFALSLAALGIVGRKRKC